jgi:hypothetical protein
MGGLAKRKGFELLVRLKLCETAGLVKLGHVALDGTMRRWWARRT